MINYYNDCVIDFNNGFVDPEEAFDHYRGLTRCFQVFAYYQLDQDLNEYVEDLRAQFDAFSDALLGQINDCFSKEDDKKRVFVDLMQGPILSRLQGEKKRNATGQNIQFRSPVKSFSTTPEPRSPLVELSDEDYSALMEELKKVTEDCRFIMFDIEEELADGTTSHHDCSSRMKQVFRYRDTCDEYDALLGNYDLTHEQQVKRAGYTLSMDELEEIEEWEDIMRHSMTPKSSPATPSPAKSPLERITASLTPPKSPSTKRLSEDEFQHLFADVEGHYQLCRQSYDDPSAVDQNAYTKFKSSLTALYCYDLNSPQRVKVNALEWTFNRISDVLLARINKQVLSVEKSDPIDEIETTLSPGAYMQALGVLQEFVEKVRDGYLQIVSLSDDQIMSPDMIQKTLDFLKQSHQVYEALLAYRLQDSQIQEVKDCMLKDAELTMLHEAFNKSQRSLPHNSEQRGAVLESSPLLEDDELLPRKINFDTVEMEQTVSIPNNRFEIRRSPLVRMLLVGVQTLSVTALMNEYHRLRAAEINTIEIPSFYIDYISMATGVVCIAVSVAALLLALYGSAGAPAVAVLVGGGVVAAAVGVGCLVYAGRHVLFSQRTEQDYVGPVEIKPTISS